MIKIYISDLAFPIFKENCISKLQLSKTENYKNLYTNSGIYKVQNNKIFKYIINIKNNQIKYINNIELICDLSTITFKEVVSQIPHDYNLSEITKKYYSFNNNSSIYFIILYENNNIIDVFIETKDLNFIDDPIITFLS